MEKRDELSVLESRQLELQARISESDRAALDYVKSLPGFREAYPEHAAEYDEAKADLDVTDEAADTVRRSWELLIGTWVNPGDVIIYDGKCYVVIQGHTLQSDWIPSQVPALYRLDGDAPSGGGDEPVVDEWPEFVQPTGAHDAYAKGAKVTYKGEHYVSLIDANVYSPEAYPDGWRKEE